MKYLLDTHTLIWFLEGDARLSGKASEILTDTKDNKKSRKKENRHPSSEP